MLKTLRQRSGTVFALVLLWKAALLVFTAQPIPANDSFFYDGAVVNQLLHGKYCNPALANALPISGNEVFSAYPPLYQLTLLGWMSVAGTSVLSAMWLHFVLFVLYAGLVLTTLRELRVPVGCIHFAGAFLLGITFHDRPDSLAQVFGMAAVYAAARAFRPSSSKSQRSSTRTKDEDEVASHADPAHDGCTDNREPGLAKPWLWLAATSVIFCLGTSLQIGGIYFLWIWLAQLLSSRLSNQAEGRARLSRHAAVAVQGNGTLGQARPTSLARFKLPPAGPALVVMTLVPVALVLGVKLLWPHLWAGFHEHAQQTPTLTSWRRPDFVELLKVIRSVPGTLLALALVPALVWRRRRPEREVANPNQSAVLFASGLASVAVLVAALFFLATNLVLIAAYLQPLVVGVFLGQWVRSENARPRLIAVKLCLGLALLLVSIRAIGLTTLGAVCAADMGEGEARRRVAQELAAAPDQATVALSSAYLYDAWPEEGRLKLLHSDWLGPATKRQPDAELDALRAAKPTRLILTQFDYYRRYARLLAQLQSTPGTVSVRVEDLARVRPPDASPRWQRVVQHVSWAPVIVTLEWGVD